jgi:hypothetical protein
MAAAAGDSSDDSSIIRIIFLKEESGWTAGLSLKEGMIRSSIRNRDFIIPLFSPIRRLHKPEAKSRGIRRQQSRCCKGSEPKPRFSGLGPTSPIRLSIPYCF